MSAAENVASTLQIFKDIRDGELDPHEAGIVPAIAMDGGGMSSIVGAGELYVAAEEGLLEPYVCKLIVGSSGGSITGAAGIAGQHAETYRTFTKTLPENYFIDPWRILRFQPMIDLALLNEVLAKELDISAIISSPIEFGLGVTKLGEGLEPVAISTRHEGIDASNLLPWIMKGIHMPRIAGKPEVDEDGTSWVDCGLSWPTTPEIASTLQKNTRILNLSNTRKKTWQYDGAQTDFVGKWIKRYGSPTDIDSYRAFARAQIHKMNGGPPANVQIIYPDPKAELPGTFEMDPERLKKGYIAGQNAMLAALELDLIEQAERPRPNRNLLFQARDTAVRVAGRSALRTVFALAP